jgi:Holliday junction resolvasome RuvABC endonuclease subunit
MTLLALDMAGKCGWAILSPRGNSSGVKKIAPDKGQHQGLRYQKLFHLLQDMRRIYPDLGMIAYEHPITNHAGSNQAAYAYGCMAVVQLFCCAHKIASRSAYPSTVKKFITGRGDAGKDAVICAVRARGFDPETDDEADAIACGLWAIQGDGNLS